jgi:hypothetical protein
MRHLPNEIVLFLFLLTLGPSPLSIGTADSQPKDCIVFTIEPGRPRIADTNADFNAQQRTDLAAIFGDLIGYEKSVGGWAEIFAPGCVYFIHLPSRKQSFFWPAVPELRVAGFFPKVLQGRLPEVPGEALVSKQPGFGSRAKTLEGSPRKIGQQFEPYVLKGTRFKIVGIAEPQMGEAIYVTDLPMNAPAEYRAGALLTDAARYEETKARLIEAGVIWHAQRIRNGRRDTSWRSHGSDSPLFAIMQISWLNRDSKPILYMPFTYYSEDPVLISDFAVELDGKSLHGRFIRKSEIEEFLDSGKIVGQKRTAPNTVRGFLYEWVADGLQDAAEHRISVRIKGVLIAVRYTR